MTNDFDDGVRAVRKIARISEARAARAKRARVRHGELSARTRDVLIEHIDGPCDVNVQTGYAFRMLVVNGAIRAGFLSTGQGNPKRPKQTFITDVGREVLARALGDWADAIMRMRGHQADAESYAEEAEQLREARGRWR